MLTETVVSTLLAASITGAGLVLAIYALITPIFNKIVETRLNLVQKNNDQFKYLRDRLEPTSEKSIDDLKRIATRIKELKSFPPWLGWGVMVDFSSFLICAYLCWAWLVSPSNRDFGSEFIVELSFIAGAVIFWFVGAYTILEVSRAMKADWKRLEEEKKEAEKTTEKELAQLKEEVEKLKRRNIHPT